MDPERWQRIKEVFAAALDLPPEQRAEWLSITLPDNPALAREVQNLLAAYDEAGDFYEQGALAAIPDLQQQPEGAVEGMRVGPYRVLSELGHGGMGAVYLAVREEPSFTQTVALKLIKRGMDTDEIVRRFVAERQILASLTHPNIARLFDGGSTPGGRPYFVMEYVEGQPITVYASERKLSIEARLHLFLRVCRAVQHAHQSLVVHRDLKPANILVDAEGEPKLLDFGIAKLLDPTSFGGMTALTGLAPGPMTPDYASPEQLAGSPVTTATDVYGLGLLLYELLVGQNPRKVERTLGEGWDERPPSQALTALTPGDAETRRLARRVAGDLDTIVAKALEPEPQRRYGTAAALAEDVERHLTQRPVAARRPTPAYRLSRIVARHKLAAALALATCLFTVVVSYEAVALSQERNRVEAQREKAEALSQYLQRMIQRADPQQNSGKPLTRRQILDAGAWDLLVRDTRFDPQTRAALLETVGSLYVNLGSYEEAHGCFEQALRLREGQPKPGREAVLDIAGSWTLLGDVGFRQKKYDASRNAYQRAITLKESLLGSSALPLVKDWNGLAAIAFDENKLDVAGFYLAKSLAACRAAEGSQRELAATLNELGRLETLRSHHDRAKQLFGEAWQYFRTALGDDDPATLEARSNLAYALFQRAEYGAAEAHYQEIVARNRRLMGPDHPALAGSLVELAIAQRQCGHLTAARASLDESLEIRREHHFPADEDEAEGWNVLGHGYLDQNQLDAAEEAFRKSYETFRSMPGERRSDLARILSSQAQVHRRRNDLAGAITLARRSLKLKRSVEGEESPAIASSLNSLAELLREDRQIHGAEVAFRQALHLLSRPDWADHPDKARAEIGLGGLLVETGRAGEARPYLVDGLRIRKKVLGKDHPDTRKVMDRLRRIGYPAS